MPRGLEQTSMYSPLRGGEDGLDGPAGSRYRKSGCASTTFFSFLNPLLARGAHTPLQEDDLFDLNPKQTPAANAVVFERKWREQLRTSSDPSLVLALAGMFKGPVVAGAFLQLATTVMK